MLAEPCPSEGPRGGSVPCLSLSFRRGQQSLAYGTASVITGCFPCESSHHLPSVNLSLCLFSSYKDTSHIELGSTLMTSSYLNYIFKGPLSK